MTWQVRQHVQCDRPDRRLEGEIIQIEGDSVIISCPRDQTVVCGSQKQLERLGWRSMSTAYSQRLIH